MLWPRLLRAIFPCLLFVLLSTSLAIDQVKSLDLAPVWSGHPVGFCLLTHGDQQFVAFYDANRQMTLAQRTLGQTQWKFQKLPSAVQWDSHNYLRLALDRDNYLHLSGNMHAVPLVYFRSTKPLDIESMEAVPHMTGEAESHVTYPVFYKGPSGELIFSYRDGKSGDGNTIFNVYDEKSKSWTRLLDKPLFDGQTQRNAYMSGPELMQDSYYHLSWVWRETPMAETNHDLSYIRSRDLRHWETIEGRPVTLPITLDTPGVIVDPVPQNGGIINGCEKVGFGPKNEILISYHKFDANGKTQLYIARFENGRWVCHQASDWDYRWEIKGGGSLPPDIRLGSPEMVKGKLGISFSHVKYGGGFWELDPVTLKLIGKIPHAETEAPDVSAKFGKVESTFPGMKINWAHNVEPDTGRILYRLRWETLGANRDKPRDPPWPEPSMLRLLELPKKS